MNIRPIESHTHTHKDGDFGRRVRAGKEGIRETVVKMRSLFASVKLSKNFNAILCSRKDCTSILSL